MQRSRRAIMRGGGRGGWRRGCMGGGWEGRWGAATAGPWSVRLVRDGLRVRRERAREDRHAGRARQRQPEVPLANRVRRLGDPAQRLLGAAESLGAHRSEEHTSELQSRFGISYAV